MIRNGLLMALFALAVLPSVCQARNVEDSLLLQRIFNYRQRNNAQMEGMRMNVYARHGVTTLRKNRALILVPTMYALARRKNSEFLGESYSSIVFHNDRPNDEVRHLVVGTLPRHRRTLPMMLGMLTPRLYDVTLMQDHLLSPFHLKNRAFYRYGISKLSGGRRLVAFVPKTHNTQTVKGQAVVDFFTGRIESIWLEGEYDMISFRLEARMGGQAPQSLIPEVCDMEAIFHAMGNRIKATYHVEYGLPVELSDTIVDSHSRELMDSVRPTALTPSQMRIYHVADSLQAIADSMPRKKKRRNFFKYVLWDIVGDNLVNRIKGNFGPNDEGYFKIYPILDPLSLSYSERKGLTYKLRLRGNYALSPEKDISLYFKCGYSFKQKQFYFRLPVKYIFNAKRNGYVELEVGNGNRITNRSVVEHMIEEQHGDSARLEDLELDYFKDTYMKVRSNYDLSSRLSIGAGLTFHRRSAVNKQAFVQERRPTVYHSFAPSAILQFRPWAWNGPIITLNYEQGIRGLGIGDMEYGRVEADAVWLRKFNRLRSLSMRFGAGAYTMKDDDAYFLDYENFRENNMPGDWGDDWTGEFQLLNRDQYNSSLYYLRSNFTYESPLLFLSHAPLLGKYVEMERIYISSLFAKNIHTHTEIGYGFTNRLFSMGVFLATLNGKYKGIGCRFGIELFRDW